MAPTIRQLSFACVVTLLTRISLIFSLATLEPVGPVPTGYWLVFWVVPTIYQVRKVTTTNNRILLLSPLTFTPQSQKP